MKPSRLLILMILLGTGVLSAQESQVYATSLRHFQKGQDHWDKGLYAHAQREFRAYLAQDEPANEPEYHRLQAEAHLRLAQAAVYLDQPQGEALMLDFVRSRRPDPWASMAMLELGNYYYNKKDFDKAIEYFGELDNRELSASQVAEVRFKEGYSLFVAQEFDRASRKFAEAKEINNEYYYPSNYYYGMTQYFLENYDAALSSFDRVKGYKRYADQVPYYISQIYFSRKRYQELYDYAEPLVGTADAKKQKEIRQLLGQAYFAEGRYREAVPHLEYYETRSARMREDDFYQLGYAQYQIQEYSKAIPNFQQLTKTNSIMGQNAAYYLGDSFLKTGEKNSARTAFRRVSQLDYDKEMQAEALFNYAKLSAELGYDREAVNAFTSIPESSPYHTQSQEILGQLLVETGDYERAIEIMDELDVKSPKVREAYQKVALYRGLQLIAETKADAALAMLDKSLQYPIDPSLQSQAIFWKADIAHRRSKYDRSISLINEYDRISGRRSNPPESSPYMASYTQGYNFIKKKNYNSALDHFESAASGIRAAGSGIDPYIRTRVLADALIKQGDCQFKANNYGPAVRAYDQAIAINTSGVEYAMLQKAVILGLQGQGYDKIVILEEITTKYGRSVYADDAYYELGLSYQQLGKFPEATRAFQQIVEKYSATSDLMIPTLLQLGLLSYNQGAVNEALAYYKRIFDYNPSADQTEGALAAIREIYVEDLGDSEGYVEFLESIDGYDVSDLEKDALAFRTAENKYENAEYEAAIPAYTSYLQKYPRGANVLAAHFQRGDSYTFLKQFEKALADFEAVVKKGNSKYYERSVRNAALISYNNQEDFQAAYTYYIEWEKVAVSEQDKFEAQLGALRSAYRTSKRSEVLRLSSVVAENPRASASQRLTARFYQGKISYDDGDLGTALAAFREVAAEENTVQTAEARFRVAQILYRQGQLSDAEVAVNQANQGNSSYPYWIAKGLILLSDIYADQGKLTDSRAALEAVIDNFQDDPELIAEAEAKLRALEIKEADNSRIDNSNTGNQLRMDESGNQ